jgi:hypothetical protein
VEVGVSVAGGAITTLTRFYFNTQSQHQTVAGFAFGLANGVAAGNQTVQIWWRTAATNVTATSDTNDRSSVKVIERLT